MCVWIETDGSEQRNSIGCEQHQRLGHRLYYAIDRSTKGRARTKGTRIAATGKTVEKSKENQKEDKAEEKIEEEEEEGGKVFHICSP